MSASSASFSFFRVSFCAASRLVFRRKIWPSTLRRKCMPSPPSRACLYSSLIRCSKDRRPPILERERKQTCYLNSK